MHLFSDLLMLASIVFAMRAGHAAAAPRVDFHRDVKPILAAKCQPCHFPGGTMHERLPFDQPRTILDLGTKLFSRVKDERHRVVIRRFLAENRRKEKELKIENVKKAPGTN